MKQQSSWLVFLIISIIFIGLIGIFLIIFRPFPRVESKNLDEAILMGLKYYDPDTYINPYMDGIEFISFKVLYTNFVPNKEIERKYMELLDNPEITKKYQGYLVYFFNLTLNDTPVFKPILQSEFLSTGYDSISEITIRSMFCRDYPLPDGFFDKIEEIGSRGGYDLTHIYGAVQILEERGCEPEKTEKVKEDLVKKVYEEQLQDGNNIKDFSLYAERVFILISSGHYELVKKSWIDAIIRAQNPDGGWPSHKLGEPSFTHSTYYGLLVLLSYNKYIVQGKPLDYSVFRPLNIKIARISQDVEDELRAKGSAETIIKVSSDKDRQELLSKFGGEELSDDLVKVKITENDAKQLSHFSSVDYVYPDYQTKVLGDYLSQIKYQEALNEFNLTGKGIKICILDTGVNKSVVPYSVGYDFVNNDNDPSDDNGHGTQVASIIKSIAPDAELIVGKVVDKNGVGRISQAIRGVVYCWRHGANIIHISIGGHLNDGFCDYDPISIVLNKAVEKGMIVVSSTGNDNSTTSIVAPACARHVIAVSAVDDQDHIASFANVNPLTDVLAPGVNISTQAGSLTGTSAAAPQVSASVALLLEKEPALTPDDIEYRLRSTGKPIEFQYNDSLTVNISRLNVYNLLINNKTMEPYDYSGWWESRRFRPSIFLRIEATSTPITPITIEGTCFLAGTKILMTDGSYKNIEDVKVGDWIMSYDEKTGKLVPSRVTKTFYHSPSQMGDYYLVINGNIKVTPNHPMYVNGVWKSAGRIKVGDYLLDSSGYSVRVLSIKKVYKKVPTYNLEVDKYHNYFAEGILVHNKASTTTLPITTSTTTSIITTTTTSTTTTTTSTTTTTTINYVPFISFVDPTPSANSCVRGTKTINVSASDADRIKSISISIDSSNVKTCSYSPYKSPAYCSYSWNTASYSTGSHSISAKATDGTGKYSTTSRTIYVDNVVPSTSASAVKSDGSSYTFGTWVNGREIPVNISLSCSDTGCGGCSDTYYCNDTTNTCTPSTSYSRSRVGIIQINDEGITYVRYYSKDNLGNTEGVNSKTVNIDVTRPVYDSTTFYGCSYLSGTTCWVKKGTTVHLEITHYDTLSTPRIQYLSFTDKSCSPNVCGCSWSQYCGSGNEIKSHVNTDTGGFGDDMWNDAHLNIQTPSCTQTNGCTGTYAKFKWPVYVNSTENRDYKIYTYLYDEAYNGIGYTLVGYLKIDNTAPTTSITSPGAGSWHNSDFSVTFSDSDTGGSGLKTCYYRILDNGVQSYPTSGWATRTCSGSINIDISAYCKTQGLNKCKVEGYATDNVGNTGSTISRSFSIDTSAPTGSISKSPDTASNLDTVTFTATGSDSLSGLDKIEIYVDSTLKKTCTSSPCTYQGGPYEPQTTHTYYAKIYDKVGNVYTTSTYSFDVYGALDGCYAITSPGKYVLVNDITDSSASKCIDIQANNVVLDCQDHIIDGIRKWTTYGVYVYRSSTQVSNITIENCKFNDWIYQIYFYKATGNTVRNTGITHGHIGLYVNAYSYSNVFDNLTIKDNTGFDVFVHGAGSCNNQFTNVIGTNAKPIVYYHDQPVTIKNWNNNVSEIILCNADYSVIDNVTMIGNENNMILLRYTDYANITNVYAQDLEQGVRVHGSHNRLENITAISNWIGIYHDWASYTTFKNIVTKNNGGWDLLYYTSDSTAGCSATFENVIGSENKPIIFYGNKPAHISNWNNNVSEIILCNADHSVIDNVTIDNSADRNGIWIIGTDYSNFTNLHLMDMRYGLYLWYYSDNNIIKDSTITSSAGWGMRMYYRCNNNIISNTTFNSNYMGLRMYRSNNNTITNCKFEGNSNKAVYMYYAGDTAPNKFYNNLFNNTNNLYFAGTVYHNVWNQNKMFSKSKVGGPYMGGNYWGKPDGTGFSDTCTDADGDGICDSSYQLNSNGPNIDYYPLSLKYDKAAPTTWTVGEDDYGDVYSFNTEVRSKYVKVSLFCSDDKSGCKEIKYCVDRDNTCIPSITYENPIEITTNGKSYVRFRGIDRYSNTEEINSVVVILNTTIEKVTVEMDFDINGISGDTGMVGEEGMGVYSKSQLSKYYTCSYDSVEGGQPAAAMIFTGSKFDSASLSQDTENKMKISQYYEGNHLIIALVNGSCSAISNSYGSIGSIAYTPLSSIEFKHKYPVLVKLKYPSVDIVGNLTLGEGTHTLVFEKGKSEKGVKILVKEK